MPASARSPRILVSTSSFGSVSPEPLARLEAAGFDCRLNPHGRTLTPEETVALLAEAEGLIAGTEILDRGVLAASPSLRAISRCGAGLDNVDLAAAAELGIRVYSTPEAPVAAVAELTLAGMLALLRHLAAADRELRRGGWKKPMGRLLRGKTVGIVGLGRIGRALVSLLLPFEVRLLAADPRPDETFAARHGLQYCSLDELLARADVVTLHLTMSPEVRHLIDRPRIGRMKEGALLVNTARGGLVDEEAVAAALADGHLGGAFFDVFEQEPYRGPLARLPNALLTPHLGAYAAESRLQMELQAADNLIRHFAGDG